MELETILHYFTEYGSFAIFAIVLLEYLNLPGFPAGVIMPLAGVIKMNFRKYCISSALGVAIWNFVFIGAGYFWGDKILVYLQQG